MTRVRVWMMLLLILALGLTQSSALAATATLSESELVAKNWMTYVVAGRGVWAGSSQPQLRSVSELTWQDTILARVYNVDPEGFVIVPVSQALAPVKVYSEQGSFDVDQEFGFPQMIREILIHQLRLFNGDYDQGSGPVHFGGAPEAAWERYTLPEKEFARTLHQAALATDEIVGPLLTDSWHQGNPYNLYCPPGDGGRCIVGCTATSMSQILRFWKCPPAGVGSYCYWWDGDQSCGGTTPGQELCADYSDPYDWDNMPDALNYTATPEEEAAVAELCHEVGVLCQMIYGNCGSGAWP
jgi:hypothetical protein